MKGLVNREALSLFWVSSLNFETFDLSCVLKFSEAMFNSSMLFSAMIGNKAELGRVTCFREREPSISGRAVLRAQPTECDILAVVLPASKSVEQNEPKAEGLASIVATRLDYCVSAQAKSDGEW